jgi:hypothetical protein
MAQKCVHQGCGKEYTDPEEKCVYHPGPPVFHEGQKGMSIAALVQLHAFSPAFLCPPTSSPALPSVPATSHHASKHY